MRFPKFTILIGLFLFSLPGFLPSLLHAIEPEETVPKSVAAESSGPEDREDLYPIEIDDEETYPIEGDDTGEVSSSLESNPDFGEEEKEEGEPWFGKTHLTWENLGRYKTLRMDHPLNPEEDLFDFPAREFVSALDLEWKLQLAESVTFRSHAIGLYSRQEDNNFSRGYLIEGYLQWINQGQDIVFDLGKVKVEWGSGYAWNPTQVIIPLKEEKGRDAYDIYKKEGIGMVRLEYISGSVTGTGIFAQLEKEGVDEKYRNQLAFQLSFKLSVWDLSLVHHQATSTAPTNGLSFTGLLTDALEFHGEWSRTTERNRKVPKKMSNGILLGPKIYLPARYEYVEDTRETEFHKFLLGGQYTFSNNANIILELYRTTHGYNEQEWELVQDGIQEASREDAWKNPLFTAEQGNPYQGFIKNTMEVIGNNQIRPVRQNYLFFRFYSGESDNLWSWEQILQFNLDDQSQMHEAVLKKFWSDFVETKFSITLFRGNSFTEYDLLPYSEIYEISIQIHI